MGIYPDEEGDFLEISIGKPAKCIATEVSRRIFIRKDEKTGEVKSIGILSFIKRSKELNDIEFTLPIKISMSA